MNEITRQAAEIIRAAHALLITAGAGMGVDSGLPDFRGPEGFWRAYPPYRARGLRFEQLADPRWFRDDPALAWGFYGHRLNLYRSTRPHPGFDHLLRWARRMPGGFFVFTSNVDGQFLRAGFDEERIVECHGALDWLQCTAGCGQDTFPAEGTEVDVDPETYRARPPLPSCPRCGALARPNVLMFGDWEWDSSRTDAQQQRFAAWVEDQERGSPGQLVVVECGAGLAIPTVRRLGETLVRIHGARLIRINPRDPDVPAGQVTLSMGAREALEAIGAQLPAE